MRCPPPARRPRLAPSAGVAVVVMLVATGCSDLPSPIPDPVSREGERIFPLWRFSNVAGLLVALLVWGLIAWCVIRYRRRDDALPRQTAHNIPMEVVYTAAPVLLVAALFAATVAVQEDVTRTVERPDLVVDVTAFQWQWRFEYPDLGITVTGTPEDLPTLVLPVGRTVRLNLHTADVIHSFFVPRFLTKRDMIPGVDNEIDVRADEAGEWVGRCAEFCGIDHYKMNFSVRAVTPEAFDAWAAATAESGP